MDASTTDRTSIHPTDEGDEFPAAEGSEERVDAPEDSPPAEEPKGGDNGGLSDAELVERAQDTAKLKDLSEGEDIRESRAGAAAVAAARDGQKMREGEMASALDWFLNEDPAAAASETQSVELNFGTQDSPKWVPWTIKAVPMEVMRAIRKKAQSSRLARTTGETDEYRVNLEIVVEGTVDPDIKEATRILNEQGRFAGDPIDALRAKFQPKPGYVAQLAGKIMTLSGFNDEDVRDAERAAKN